MSSQHQGVVMRDISRPKRTAGDVIPIVFPIIIAVVQMILYLAIIGLEARSVYYHAGRGTIYAGFWCSIFFFVTSIAMLCSICCRKSRAYTIYLILQNLISLAFAIVLIVFTSLFISDPCLCYGILCEITDWDNLRPYYPYPHSNCTQKTWEKRPILKGLLSCAALMLVCNVIVVISYIIALIWSRTRTRPAVQTEVPSYEPSPITGYPDESQLPDLDRTSSGPHYYARPLETTASYETAITPVQMRSEKF